jgi:peptidoglycan/LPS O-acetylase OafA/YrhL
VIVTDSHATDGGVLPHRPGLDGLRGLAILVVLAFHAGIAGFSGGFLGVSIFFTLSGFLITSLLLAEHRRTGRIDLRAFWSRRFRRLLPAALLALGGIGVFGLTVATAEQAQRLAGDVTAAVAYLANWRFLLADTSYAELWGEPSPVLHFWSLAIEGQLYLVVPLVVAASLLVARGRMWPVGLSIGALFALSVGATVAVGADQPDRIYFGTDTRAAELLAGALLAVCLASIGPHLLTRSGPWASRVGAGSLALLAGLVVIVDTRTSWLYHGGLVLVAMLSVALLIGVITDGPLARTLAAPPLRWLGTRSYGIYLYHWPVFLWLDGSTTGLDGFALVGVRLAVTFGLAEASLRLVEGPIRAGRRLPRPGIVVVPQVAAAVVGVALVATLTAPAPLLQLAQTVDRLPPPPTVVERNPLGPGTTEPPSPLSGPAPNPIALADTNTAPPNLVVIGDTFAPRIAAELAVAVERRTDLRLLDATHPTCSWFQVLDGSAPASCAQLGEAWAAASSSAEVVVVSLGVGGPALGGRAPADPGELIDGLRRLRARLSETATIVWVAQPLVLDRGDPAAQTIDPAATAWPALAGLIDAVSFVAAEHGDTVHDLARYLRFSERNQGRGHTILDHDAAAITLGVGWVTDQLTRPLPRPDALRLLVVGDSVAYNLGRGFEHHAADDPDLVVWNVGATGCGLVRGGTVPAHEFQPSDACELWPDRFAGHLADFDPHLVFLVSTGWDLLDRKLPGWSRFRSPGDPVFDAFMRDEYRYAVEVLTSTGATVVWGLSPCVSREQAFGSVFDPERVAHQERILAELDRRFDRLRLVDLDPLACPDARFTNTVDGIANFRPDGVHYSEEGARWMAGHLIPMLVDVTG